MHVSEDGTVVGSIDRAKLEELQQSAKSDEAKAQLEQLQGEAEAVEAVEAQASAGQVAKAEVVASEPKPSMALSKDELVDLAEAAGLGNREELEQFTKQELVDELKASEET